LTSPAGLRLSERDPHSPSCLIFKALNSYPIPLFHKWHRAYPKYGRQKKIPESLKGSGIPFFILFRHISPSAGRRLSSFYSRQVFWLPDHPTCRAFPILESVAITVFVPGHSGGPATDFHRFPYYSPMGYPQFQGEYRTII
jgi:hypothetical protein